MRLLHSLMALGLFSLSVATAGAVDLGMSSVTDGVGVSDFIYVDGELDLMKAAGVKVLRADLTWANVETTAGVYDFSGYVNQLSADCAARGIRILHILDYDNAALYGSDLTSNTFRTGFANYAAAAAANFKGQGAMFEIWNEPNTGGYAAMQSATNYVNLVKKASPAIRAADPSAVIVGPALGGSDSTAINWLGSCCSKGVLSYLDAVSIHPYAAGAPEGAVSIYTSVKSLISAHSSSIPIVSSEYGVSSMVVPAQTQGDYLARMYLVNFSQGVPLSCWYTFKDGGWEDTNVGYHYGTVTPDLVAKPAYNELHLLTASLKGTTFSQTLSDGNSADWLLEFALPSGQKTLAAWTTGDAHSVTISSWGTLHLTSTPYYVNPTLLPGDINLDGTVNVQDLAVLAANYRKNTTGGWLQGDFNNDGVVDVQDLALLAANYRRTQASDVVPDYAGFDAAAIQVLSQAGITVVPEPGAITLLACGLIGLLAYAWRGRRQCQLIAFQGDRLSSGKPQIVPYYRPRV